MRVYWQDISSVLASNAIAGASATMLRQHDKSEAHVVLSIALLGELQRREKTLTARWLEKVLAKPAEKLIEAYAGLCKGIGPEISKSARREVNSTWQVLYDIASEGRTMLTTQKLARYAQRSGSTNIVECGRYCSCQRAVGRDCGRRASSPRAACGLAHLTAARGSTCW